MGVNVHLFYAYDGVRDSKFLDILKWEKFIYQRRLDDIRYPEKFTEIVREFTNDYIADGLSEEVFSDIRIVRLAKAQNLIDFFIRNGVNKLCFLCKDSTLVVPKGEDGSIFSYTDGLLENDKGSSSRRLHNVNWAIFRDNEEFRRQSGGLVAISSFGVRQFDISTAIKEVPLYESIGDGKFVKMKLPE